MQNLKFFFRCEFSLIIFLCINIQDGHAQTLGVGFCAVFTHTRQKVRMIHSKDDFQNTSYTISFNYEQYFLNTRKSIQTSYMKYPGYTFIKFREGSVIASDGFPVVGDGFSGVDIHKLDLCYSYNLIHIKRFLLKPSIGLSLQKSVRNHSTFWNDLYKINGPEYFETDPIRVESLNTFQVLPPLGLKLDLYFGKE